MFADEYGDWIGISNVAQQMFLSDITLDASRNLSYRGALTSNLIAINGFEAAVIAQPTAAIDLLDNEYIISNTIRKCESQLMGNAVPGRDGGMYTSAMHPYSVYDFMSDNSAGSAVDTLKRSEAGANVLKTDMTRGYSVLEWAGVRIIRTQTVPTYANYPSVGKTGYATYVVGREAMLASELLGTRVPRSPSFKVNVKTFGDNDIELSDPMLQTPAIVSYDWFLGVVARPNTNGTPGFRRVRAEVFRGQSFCPHRRADVVGRAVVNSAARIFYTRETHMSNASTIRRQIAGTQQLTIAPLLYTVTSTTETAFQLTTTV